MTQTPAEVTREWLPGAVSGSVQVLVGHPFDTVKTRSQALNNTSSWQSATILYKECGFRGFYRGVVPPIMVTASKRGIQLLMWERLTPLLGGNTFAAGAVTGGLGTFISCPLHVVKITAQTKAAAESNSRAALMHILGTTGVRGLYRGFPVHMARDTVFASTYLGLYGYLRKALPSDLPLRVVAAAVAASIFTWGVLQPFDTVKTMAQLGMPWSVVLRNAVSGNAATTRSAVGRSWR